MDSAEVEDSTEVDSADEGVGGVWETTVVVCEPPPEGPTGGKDGLEPVSEADEGLPTGGPVAVGLPGVCGTEEVLIWLVEVLVYLVVVLEADEQSKETVGIETPQVEEALGILSPDWPEG